MAENGVELFLFDNFKNRLTHSCNLLRFCQSSGRESVKLSLAPSNFYRVIKGGVDGFLSFFLMGKQKSLAFAHVAQLAEHVLGKDEVISSILIMGSKICGE